MLNTEERQKTKYFVGDEVEHTICFGKKTLFVVGVAPTDTIKTLALENQCDHIYFGTSQSFTPSVETFNDWHDMIQTTLKEGFWVTLDFDVAYASQVLEAGWNEFPKFVSMISVKLPYINQFNYNATLKLDDITWGATNPGVWTHHLPTLLTKDQYTHWDQYTQDTEINE